VRRLVGHPSRVLGLATSIGVLLVSWPITAAFGSGDLLGAIENAPIVVVAEVRGVDELPHAGYSAQLTVERMIVSPSPDSTRAPGPDDVHADLVVAWEEPAPSLPPRLVVGRRVLVAAGPLPTASIWRVRVPDAEARAALLGLAGDGEGLLDRPGAAEIDVLEHYLAVDRTARGGDAGVLHMARLCAVGQSRLALAAADRLGDMASLDGHWTPPAASAFIDALLRTDVEGLGERLRAVLSVQRPAALRAPLRARIAREHGARQATLYAALGALDGGLDDDVVVMLLRDESTPTRVAAAEHASGPRAHTLLRDLLRGDPEPSVRAAAVTRLVALDGNAALSDATLALDDPSGEVRLAALRAAAELDPDSVESLRRIAFDGRPDAARAAVAALSLMGPEAHQALAEMAVAHPDEGLRNLAGIAVGQPIGDRH